MSKKPPKPPEPPPRELIRRFASALGRARSDLVPPAFAFLWQTPRFLVAWGGRASGKSWSIARVLLSLAYERKLRVLCCREIQSSVRESAYRLLADQVRMLDLEDHYEIRADSIIGRNGSEFIFEGLRYNISRLRSLEGVDICWVEEAQAVSERSWEDLIPTIRKRGSRFFISFNPLTPEDPVAKRFVEAGRSDVIAQKVGWEDNPFLAPEVIAEKDWLRRTDVDSYNHVWQGMPRTVSDALILKGKYSVESFEVQSNWSGPHFGLDYGFSRDPSAAVRCYIDDETRTLYVTHEFWQLACDIDALPGALEAAVPGIGRHTVYADSARPETTSYLAKNGIPSARSAEKWPGSVDDGIAYLRSFTRIVIDPSCKHLLDECGRYSFKCDRLTGVPLPEPIDAHNHLIDSLRYALSPLIRNKPSGGFFSRAALLVNGEPVEFAGRSDRPWRVFATLALGQHSGAVGAVFWANYPHTGVPLRLLGYDLAELDEALGSEWLLRVIARAQELRAEWDAVDAVTRLWCEEGELHNAFVAVFTAHLLSNAALAAGQRPPYDLSRVESERLPVTLDERASAIRAAVNGGGLVKFARSAYGQQLTHRSATDNHLAGQVFGYRPGVEAAQELVSAFCLGVLVAPQRQPVPLTQLSAPFNPLVPAVHAPLPAPRPPPQPMALLKPGRRVIDGVAVDVPPAPDGRELVWFPLSAGMHVIDNVMVRVDSPGGGIRVA